VKAIEVQSHPWTEWSLWSPVWSELHEGATEASFFLTADWVGTWLEVFGAALQPRILVFSERDPRESRVVGICLLSIQTYWAGPIRVRRAHLNTSGELEADEVCSEDNALLCRAGAEDAVASALAAHLQTLDWDELVLNAWCPSPSLDALLRSPLERHSLTRTEMPSHFVDLRAIGAEADGYLKTLSRNTREQVRRSRRSLEANAPIEVRPALTPERCRQAFEELASLHTASWNARGKPGVFGSPVFRDFHERLIRRLLPSGRVALLEIASGDLKLAVLYNFVHAGASFFYQSGLRRDPDKRVKIGLVAHASAIEHCRAGGLARYDFLASDDQYKKSLASASRPQSWLVFRKRNAKLETLDLLRKTKRALLAQRHRD
jgi:CelD/BcsL family acetyltransferase involved in cellulose biosynthesis